MSEDLSEVIKYITKRFNKVNKQLQEMRKDFSVAQNSVDNYTVKADKYFQ